LVGSGGVLPDPFLYELRGDPTVGPPHTKVWTRGQNGRSSAKDGAPKRLRCGTIQEEVSQILQIGPQALQEKFTFCFILYR